MSGEASRLVNNGKSNAAPWVLVAGGFHQRGGMDRANAALATYLTEQQIPVHLVAHQVDSNFLEHAGISVHIVPKPASSYFLGEWHLARCGRAVARRVIAEQPRARVLVNGGNCLWPDINWVHYVHHAWQPETQSAPLKVKAKNKLTNSFGRRREGRAISMAKLILANSEVTRRDLIKHTNADPHRIHTVYLGSDSSWSEVSKAERTAARRWLGITEERPIVVFIGALGRDERKGLDTLWAAWRKLCARADWDADLIVAGGGSEVGKWQGRVNEAGLAGRVRLLGFTERVADLLAAADLLVSPVRYEAYGLNVQEAICRGVPALVSGCAGVAERYTPELQEMILADPEDYDGLAARLLRWRLNINFWKQSFQLLGARLRGYSWTEMARQIVALAESAEVN